MGRRGIAAAILLLLAAAAIVLGVRVSQHVATVDAGLRAAEQALGDATSLQSQDLTDLQRTVQEGEKALRSLKWETAPAFWFSPVLRYLPGYGGSIRESRSILSYGLHLVKGADLTLRGLEPVAAAIEDDRPLGELIPEIGLSLEDGQDLFIAAGQEVALAREIRSRIQEERLTSGVRGRLERGDALASRLDTLTALGLRGPSATAALARLADQMLALEGQFQRFQDEGLTLQSLQGLTPLLDTLEAELLQVEGQLPDLSLLSPYIGMTPEEIDANLSLALELLRASRLVLNALGPAVETLNDSTLELHSLDEQLREARETLLAASDLLEGIGAMSAMTPLLQSFFPGGQGLDGYVVLLRQAVAAGLEGPDLFQMVFVLQVQAEALKGLLEGLQGEGVVLDLEALEEAAGETESLLVRLKDAVEEQVPGLQLLGIDGERVLADLSFYETFFQAIQLTAQGIRPLHEILQQDAPPDDPYATLRTALESGSAAFEGASTRLTLLDETRSATQPSPFLEPFLPSREEMDSGLSALASMVTLREQFLALLDHVEAATQQYQALTETLAPSLNNPIQIALSDLSPYRSTVQAGLSNIREARTLWERILVDLLDTGLVPGMGEALTGMDTILAGAQTGFQTTSLALDAAESLSALGRSAVFSTGFEETVQQALPNAMSQILEAQQQVLQGLEALAPLVSPTSAVFIRGAAVEIQGKLDSLSTNLQQGADYLEVVSFMLGLDSPKVFLILGQDDQEIRATGGFIGTVHEVVLDRGGMTITQFLNSYDVDPTFEGAPMGPQPFCRYWIGIPCIQTFRDANWWADFPTSAQLALQVYSNAQGVAVDGVIAVDSWLMAQIVDSLGGVQLPGLVQEIDGVTAREYAPGRASSYPCAPENSSDIPNRCFVEDLFDALLARVTRSSESTPGLMELLVRATLEKHLLVYLPDERMAPLLANLNWDGHLLETQSDYLMVVDTSVYSEIHDYVSRSIDYRVDLGDGDEGTASLTVSYFNSVIPGAVCVQFWRQSCYWNYMRVYIPQGSTLTGRPELPLPEGSTYEANARLYGYEVDRGDTFSLTEYQELDKMELAGYVAPNGGESLNLTFEYSLPEGAIVRTPEGTWRYHLVIQKQPGTVGDSVTLTLLLPENSTLVEASSAPTTIEGSELVFELTLDTDLELFVEFTAG